VPEWPGLLEFGDELKYTSRSALEASLAKLPPTKKGERPAREVVKAVEEIASKVNLRFFHWELEFPEVFFGFADKDQRRLMHKSELSNGSAGFDSIIGNPPWGAEIGFEEKSLFSSTTLTTSRFDTYVLLIERAITVACSSARIGYLIPTSWLTVGFYKPHRVALLRCGQFKELASCFLLFDDVNLDTMALIFAKKASQSLLELSAHEATPVISGQCRVRIARENCPIRQRLAEIGVGHWLTEYEAAQEDWAKNDDVAFRIRIAPDEVNFVRKLLASPSRIRDHFKAAVGIQAYHHTYPSQQPHPTGAGSKTVDIRDVPKYV
jgi:hypothetical protein